MPKIHKTALELPFIMADGRVDRVRACVTLRDGTQIHVPGSSQPNTPEGCKKAHELAIEVMKKEFGEYFDFVKDGGRDTRVYKFEPWYNDKIDRWEYRVRRNGRNTSITRRCNKYGEHGAKIEVWKKMLTIFKPDELLFLAYVGVFSKYSIVECRGFFSEEFFNRLITESEK